MNEKEKCLNLEKNKEKCPCPNESCIRHGFCCECIEYHKENAEKPMCLR